MMIPLKPVLAAIMSLAVASIAQAQHLSVEASKTIPLRLTGSASSIVIGNKNIADVSIHNEQLLFVTGKSYGTTNLMVFDKAGRQIYSSDVMVTTNSTHLVTVNRAGQSFTYDCSTNCKSVLSLGDDPGHFASLIEQQLQAQALTEGQ